MQVALKSEYPKEHTVQSLTMRSRALRVSEPITERLLNSIRKETRRSYRQFNSLRMNTLFPAWRNLRNSLLSTSTWRSLTKESKMSTLKSCTLFSSSKFKSFLRNMQLSKCRWAEKSQFSTRSFRMRLHEQSLWMNNWKHLKKKIRDCKRKRRDLKSLVLRA